MNTVKKILNKWRKYGTNKDNCVQQRLFLTIDRACPDPEVTVGLRLLDDSSLPFNSCFAFKHFLLYLIPA